MQRTGFPLLFGVLLLGAWGIGCLADLEDLCQSDADCQAGARCVRVEGFKTCLVGGTGGTGGGTGGSAGSGGPGGTGGGGSGGVETFDAELALSLEAADTLEAFLDGLEPRLVDEVIVRYEIGGDEREARVGLEAPAPLPVGPFPVEVQIPREVEELRFVVEARALRSDDSPGLFAVGEVSGEVVAGETTQLEASLTLHLAFDWDLDDDPDTTDCEPDNEDRSHTTYEICDGVPQACNPKFCFIPLDPGQSVRDLSCSPGQRKCAAAIADPDGESGAVRIYDPRFEAPPVQVEGIDNPLGVAWNEADGHVVVTVRSALIFFNAEGTKLSGTLSPSRSLTAPLEIFSNGNFGVVSVPGRQEIEAFNPGVSSRNNVSCNGLFQQCKTVDVSELKEEDEDTPPLSSEAVILEAQIFKAGTGFPVVYLTFSGDDRLGVVRIDDDSYSLQDGGSGLLSVFAGEVEPRALSLAHSGILVIAGGAEPESSQAKYTTAVNTHQAHEIPKQMRLPKGSCPAALDAGFKDDALLMADDCTGSLWELPLDEEGKPKGEGFEQHRLARCEKPFELASLPGTEEEEGLSFVGCEGEEHILVLGRY